MNWLAGSVALGLLSALSWGSGDFCGGMATRRANPFGVVLGVQFVGGLALFALALLTGEALPPPATWAWAALAGLGGAVGLVALYSGLATGNMGIVAPVSGVVGAAVPIAVAALTDGSPGLLPLAGFLLGLLAVWLLAGGRAAGAEWRSMGLPLLAGVCFGLYFVFMAFAAEDALWWPLVIARLLSTLLLTPLVLLRAAQATLPGVATLPLLIAGGLLDSGGNLFYALAVQAGRMDTAAVLSSLYPAATVGLAWLVLRERLSTQQWVGVALGLLAIPLIAA